MQPVYDCYVDIVACIDATQDMKQLLPEVKEMLTSITSRIAGQMHEYGKTLGQLRIKLITFRDFAVDRDALEQTSFYTLPDQSEEFAAALAAIDAHGGGDLPENALEALALALKSDWTTGGYRRRHVVLLFTDAAALPLGARADCPGYPQGMPRDMQELAEWWEGVTPVPGSSYSSRAGRLVAFVPCAEPWEQMQAWNRYWPAFIAAAPGTIDMDSTVDTAGTLIIS